MLVRLSHEKYTLYTGPGTPIDKIIEPPPVLHALFDLDGQARPLPDVASSAECCLVTPGRHLRLWTDSGTSQLRTRARRGA
jgi:hypothetical protein